MSTTQLAVAARVHEIYNYSLEHQGGTFDEQGNPVSEGIALTVRIISIMPSLNIMELSDAISTVHPDMLIGVWFDFENDQWEISETVIFHRLIDAQRIGSLIGERYVFHIPVDQVVTTEIK